MMRALFLALAVVVSLVPLWPVYQDPAFFIALTGGAVLGAVIALFSARGSWSVLRTALTAVVAYVVFGVPLAVPNDALLGFLPSLQGELSLLAGAVLSWKQLVTVMPPVGAYEALLVPVFLLSLLGVLLAVVLSLRMNRLTGSASLAALVPVITLAVAIWLGPSRSFASVLVTGGVFVLIALWFAFSRVGIARAGFRAIGILVLSTVVASAVVLVTPITDRTVWRTEIEQPFVLQDDTSPLSEYRSYVSGDDKNRDLLTVVGLNAGQRVSIATLDNYTGIVYSVGGVAADFTKLPGSIPVNSSDGERVSAEITISGLSGAWVPLTGELGSLSFTGSGSRALTDDFYYSRPAGTGAVTTGLAQGDAYRTTGLAAPEVLVDSVGSLEPGDASVPAPEVMPDGLDAFVSLAAKGQTTAGERLQASLEALTSEGYISHGGPDEVPSASGHGANRLAALFAASPMVGDAEQYAAAASLMATQIGFPSRVVMGFIAPEGSDADTGITFTGAEMTAWIEISTSQGWVAVNPNPAQRPIPDEQPQDPTEVAFPQTAVEPPAQEEPQLNDNSAPEAADEEQPTVVDPVLQAILAVLSVVGWSLFWLGLMASPFLGVIVAKRRRRTARQSAADPRDRVDGAWSEIRDALVDHGTRASQSNTRLEVAEMTNLPAATVVAVLADTAQYSADVLSESEVSRAWAEADGVVKALGADLTRWQKIRSKISVKSFGLSWARFTAWLPKRR
ncbi:MAG: hypothetical protein RI926_1130 [Actinomycetota bacterium]|jgi:hypothetical protein